MENMFFQSLFKNVCMKWMGFVKSVLTPIFVWCYTFINICAQNQIATDVLIVGGGASGVSAGVQAARMGVSAIIVEKTSWVGGMLTAAGVSAIDGNYNLPAGMWGEFKDSLVNHYGTTEKLRTGWVSNVLFEPSVGNRIFRNIIAKEDNLRLFLNAQLLSLSRNSTDHKWIAKISGYNGEDYSVSASIVVDATELGDIAKMVGVKYDIGMESRYVTKEEVAPEEANGIIQDLTYVAILKDYGKDVTIEKPEGYSSSVYACSAINELCINPSEPDRMWTPEKLITYGKLPGDKYMINWPIEGNDYYLNVIELSPEERTEALKKAKAHTLGFVYFLQKELGFSTLGLADDEFPTVDKLPFIPYHRESRRIHGQVRFTLNHITSPYAQGEALYRTSIAVGDYPVDHHHARYTGKEKLPRLYFHPVPSFGLPLGTLIPKDVDNFIVAEKSISVSNIVNGATRLQPVVLQIGTAAGALAAAAVKTCKSPAQVSVRSVQRAILDAGGYLLPYLDVPVNDRRFKVYQRIGATGILKGEGRNVGWANQTWLRADTLLLSTELDGLKEMYPDMSYQLPSNIVALTFRDAIDLIQNIVGTQNIMVEDVEALALRILEEFNVFEHDDSQFITRGEFAILIDRILNPFEYRELTLKGEFKK